MPQILTAEVCWLNFMGWMMLDVYPNGGCLTGMVIIGYHHVLIGFDGTIPGIEDL